MSNKDHCKCGRTPVMRDKVRTLWDKNGRYAGLVFRCSKCGRIFSIREKGGEEL